MSSQYDNKGFEYDRQQLKWSKKWPEDTLIMRGIFNKLKGKTCLDVGCGSGDIVYHMNALGINAKGIDESAESIKLANQKYKNISDSFAIACFSKLPYPDSTFDSVFSRFAIHYSVDPNVVFEEIARVLKPGGVAHIFLAHPFLLFVHKNAPNYHEQEIVDLTILENLIVKEPSHTFADYLSKGLLENFSLMCFFEAKDTFIKAIINKKEKKIPTFFYMELKKKLS